MKKLIFILSLFATVALYFSHVQESTHTVNYSAFEGGKIGSVNIEIDGKVEKVTGGDIQKLYWSADEGIKTITVKENDYLFHKSYEVVSLNK